MAQAAIQITGMKELLRNFELTARDVKNFARGATHKVAGEVRKQARVLAPKDSGRLRKAIKTKRRRERNGLYRSDLIVNTGDSRKDPKGAFYWFFVEFGTLFQAAQPFIAPALEAVAPRAISVFKNDVLKRAIKKAERRAKR